MRTGGKPSNKSMIWSNELSDEFNLEIINTRGGKQVNGKSNSYRKNIMYYLINNHLKTLRSNFRCVQSGVVQGLDRLFGPFDERERGSRSTRGQV